MREFYLRYIQALLDEFGKEVDGFIWDETLSWSPMIMGPSDARGMRAARMMTLVKEVAAEVANFSPQLAFLASDDIGAWSEYRLSRALLPGGPWDLSG